MAIVFERKLNDRLAELKMKKSDLRYDPPHEGLLHPSVLYKLFSKDRSEMVNTDTIDKLCTQLQCQPGDIMEYIPDAELESYGPYKSKTG